MSLEIDHPTPITYHYPEGLLADLFEHDQATLEHSIATARTTLRFAAVIGLDPSATEIIFRAALYHDNGKLDTPTEILTKPSALDDAERKALAHHPADGAVGYLQAIRASGSQPDDMDRTVASIILHHHPYGDRRNNQIPSVGRQDERQTDLFLAPTDPQVRLLTPVIRLVDTLCASQEQRPDNPPDPPFETRRKLLEGAAACSNFFAYDPQYLQALALGLFVVEVEANEADIAELQTLCQNLAALAEPEREILANLIKAI